MIGKKLYLAVFAVVALVLGGLAPIPVQAVHQVLIEGEQDFDGDGLIGAAEDTDGRDFVFGTITAALGADNGGLAQNGKATIVTSGRFNESVMITGQVFLQGAPGVEADIEGFVPPAAGPGDRRGAPGVIINTSGSSLPNPVVTLKNLSIRNWTDGVRIMGGAKVNIIDCVIENNLAAPNSTATSDGIVVSDGSSVAVIGTTITRNKNAGIRFDDGTTGAVTTSTITFNAGAGIRRGAATVVFDRVTVIGNNPDFASGQ
jgi:hypothetical protein